jgi:hypothetical protein
MEYWETSQFWDECFEELLVRLVSGYSNIARNVKDVTDSDLRYSNIVLWNGEFEVWHFSITLPS